MSRTQAIVFALPFDRDCLCQSLPRKGKAWKVRSNSGGAPCVRPAPLAPLLKGSWQP